MKRSDVKLSEEKGCVYIYADIYIYICVCM